MKKPTPGERMSLGLKVTAEVKGRLDQEAKANGRTQSQEAELRLERSFEHQDLLHEVLELKFGRTLAGILLAQGLTMQLVGPLTHLEAHFSADGSRTINQAKWNRDPETIEEAIKAASLLLKIFGPARDDILRELMLGASREKLIDDCGHAVTAVDVALLGICGEQQEFDRDWAPIREMLGPIAEQIKERRTDLAQGNDENGESR